MTFSLCLPLLDFGIDSLQEYLEIHLQKSLIHLVVFCLKFVGSTAVQFTGRGSQICISNVLVFHGLHDAMYLMRFPGALEEKQPHSITDPSPYLRVGIRLFSV